MSQSRPGIPFWLCAFYTIRMHVFPLFCSLSLIFVFCFSLSLIFVSLFLFANIGVFSETHHKFRIKKKCSESCFYASPTSGEAYRDRRLTTNFELWVEIFCVPTCFHVRIPKPRLSVCPHPKKRYHHNFVNISPTLVIDTSMERSSRVLHHGNPKIWFFFFKKVRNWIWLVFWLVLKSLNQHSSRSQHAPICRHRGCIVVPLRVDI